MTTAVCRSSEGLPAAARALMLKCTLTRWGCSAGIRPGSAWPSQRSTPFSSPSLSHSLSFVHSLSPSLAYRQWSLSLSLSAGRVHNRLSALKIGSISASSLLSWQSHWTCAHSAALTSTTPSLHLHPNPRPSILSTSPAPLNDPCDLPTSTHHNLSTHIHLPFSHPLTITFPFDSWLV